MLLLLVVLLFVIYLLLLRTRSIYKKKFFEFAQFNYAHRGLFDKTAGVAENSLTAFKRAAKCGYGAELDVRLSRDGKLMVMHDENIKRTCGVSRIVEEYTANELRKYKLLGTNEQIPFLEEVLEIFDGCLPLMIELKTRNDNYKQLCEAVFMVLDEYNGSYCIQSFDPRVLKWLKKNRPHILRGQLSGLSYNRSGISKLAEKIAVNFLIVNAVGMPDFVSYRFEKRGNISLKLCRRLYGTPVLYWTIRQDRDFEIAKQDFAGVIFETESFIGK